MSCYARYSLLSVCDKFVILSWYIKSNLFFKVYSSKKIELEIDQ